MTRIRLVLHRQSKGINGALLVTREGVRGRAPVWLPKAACQGWRDVGQTINRLPIISVEVAERTLKAKGLLPDRVSTAAQGRLFGAGDTLAEVPSGSAVRRVDHEESGGGA